MIKEFQEKHNLTADGIIGKNTLSKMRTVFGIPRKEHMAHFIGQVAHETGGFQYKEENLNYSTDALLRVFPKYFKSWNEAAKVARKPEQIANIVYGGRMGNYDKGDGWKFRGRGAIQLTGRDNYEIFANKMKDLCVIKHPDLVISKYLWESALFYFTQNRIWPHCDFVDDNSIISVTRRINGGTNGLKDRIEKTKYYYSILCR